MRIAPRHRRNLLWLAAIASAATIAVTGASVVLAEEPACVIDGQPISAADAAADPTLCPPPAPSEPAPEAPTPESSDPAPAPDPALTTTDPIAPSDPTAADPATSDPAPAPIGDADPSTTEAPTDTTTAPQATTTAPAPTVDPTATTEPAATTPAPTTSTHRTPARGTGHRRPRPLTAAQRRARAHFRHAHATDPGIDANDGQDARLFREAYTPTGRIPDQPLLSASRIDVLHDAAASSGVDWSLLAAVAWLDTKWGTDGAGAFIGTHLTPTAWSRWGVDGDEDGAITRSSEADQAATTGNYMAHARRNIGASLRSYYAGPRRLALTRRALFLGDFYAAVGSTAIERGLDDDTAREELATRVLADTRIDIYEGGRSDIEAGLVDPRVLVTLGLLANRFDTVRISSLVTGHGVYTASGNVSLHSYGQAVDIAALDGESINGHQQRGGRAYRAVRELLLLPPSMQPKELISLWEFGGPSFALPDHADHVHVGFTRNP